MIATPEQLAQVAADQRQAEADAAARREFYMGRPGEGLTAGRSGVGNEPVVPAPGPESGLGWLGVA